MNLDPSLVRQRNAFLTVENRKYGQVLRPLPREEWPKDGVPRTAVFRSRDFLVQEFAERGMVRLSINRTRFNKRGDWQEGISWDELQTIKTQCGYGNREAVEVFPCVADEVRAANMRHIWIFPEGYQLPFAWHGGKGSGHRLGCAALAFTDGVHNA